MFLTLDDVARWLENYCGMWMDSVHECAAKVRSAMKQIEDLEADVRRWKIKEEHARMEYGRISDALEMMERSLEHAICLSDEAKAKLVACENKNKALVNNTLDASIRNGALMADIADARERTETLCSIVTDAKDYVQHMTECDIHDYPASRGCTCGLLQWHARAEESLK